MTQPCPHNLTLSADEIHVWSSNLALPSEEIEQLELILSEDEKLRANRFRFPHLRNRFIAARGTLRQLLGLYLQTESHLIEFQYSSRGKPSLAATQLQFNLSHSENLAVYGFCYHPKIGIDLEYLRPISDVDKLAQRFFSPQEYRLISNLNQTEKLQVFLQIWTAKEAYLKATGEGLAGSLATVEFGWEKGQITKLISVPREHQAANNWLIKTFIPDDNYLGTVAVEQQLPFSCPNQAKIKFWTRS